MTARRTRTRRVESESLDSITLHSSSAVRPRHGWGRRLLLLLLALSCILGAALWLWIEPASSPHLFHVYSHHGVDAADLLALPLLLGAGVALWYMMRPNSSDTT